jgi:FkbM family methyltransferase
MTKIQGLWWPDGVRPSQCQHSLKHVRSIEWAMAHCQLKRVALQAGGNVGLWPRRLAQEFDRVITFEPDAQLRACLIRNVASCSVEVCAEALGDVNGVCGLARQSLGSHCVIRGNDIQMTTIDALGLPVLDFLQLDIEGYEWHALMGGRETIARCQPVIQLELRNFTEAYGQSDDEVRRLLDSWGYREVAQQPGNDVVFEVAA